MFGLDDAVGAGLGVVNRLIDRLWADPAERERAKMELAKMEAEGELDTLKVRLSAIIQEAASADPWTSRARPSFLYVVYVMILTAIPMGVVHAIHPGVAENITAGVTAWLHGIPEEMWWLFGAGYLGYTTARTVEKRLPARQALGIKTRRSD